MTGLRVYGFCAASARPRGVLGAEREPLRVIRSGRLGAVVGRAAGPPVPDERRLLRHAAAMKRLAARMDAILPARFGSFVASESELLEKLRAGRAALARALALVRGRAQMTIRVFRSAPLVAAGAPAPPPGGREYLERKARDGAREGLPAELGALGAALEGLVVAEFVERHAAPPLFASVHHLVARGEVRRYRAAARRLAREDEGHRYLVSGPNPPYAFAPREPGR